MAESSNLPNTQPYRQCTTCGDLAGFWVTEDDRLPRPICERCLRLLQASMSRKDTLERERLVQATRRMSRKTQRRARRDARKRR